MIIIIQWYIILKRAIKNNEDFKYVLILIPMLFSKMWDAWILLENSFCCVLTDCPLWSLLWPQSSSLCHLQELWCQTSNPLPPVSGSLCVKTEPARRAFYEQVCSNDCNHLILLVHTLKCSGSTEEQGQRTRHIDFWGDLITRLAGSIFQNTCLVL